MFLDASLFSPVLNAEELGPLNADEVHEMLVRFEYLGLVDRSVPQS